MKRLIEWIDNNILFILTLFLLAFIPLYPKIPLLDVQHTWVYVRVEDFLILFTYVIWIIQFIRKKAVINTPLTVPILLFWIIGAFATVHGILLIFPTLSNVFPNVALLNYLRRVEYIGLFFVGYSAMKNKKYIYYIVAVLTITLLLVCLYGFGQKYLGFPAYLTMNEEFSKGAAMQLSSLSRIPSTFGGQYDLAAYLVLIIPILASMIFGFKSWLAKVILFGIICLGFILMFMTVSRAAFIVLLLALVMMLFLQKKRLIILILFAIALISLSFTSSLSQRFGNTLKKIDVLVDAKTGYSLGNVHEVSSVYFKDKIVRRFVLGTDQNFNTQSTSSAFLPFSAIPQIASLVVEPNASTGESLPQGTGYINLPLTPISKKVEQYFYQRKIRVGENETTEIVVVYGNFLIKKAVAYDLSFTTRFQGEWPHALMLFQKNIFFGSGYSSTGIAVDNNYLRILGEIGLFGLLSFFALFLVVGIYVKRIFLEIDSSITRSFLIGFIAGTFGLILNAIFIDVFEASKIAYVFWLLMGIVLGTAMLYQKVQLNLFKESKKILTSSYAIIVYLFTTVMVIFSSGIGNFFVGDDFTWLRWAADCSIGSKLQVCQSIIFRIFQYFTSSDGFFYRPGTKIYFLLMYSGFWLNQSIYHLVSILLHFVVVTLVFILAKKILKDFRLSVLSAFLFLILSGYSETIFWISSVGFIFNAIFILLGLLLYISWKEKGKNIYFVFSIISIFLSLLFHELGVVAPLLVILYDFIIHENFSLKNLVKKSYYLIILSPLIPYLFLRLIAHSHWFSGDYNYNLVKLPFNIIGNSIGYLGVSFIGPLSLPFYEILRNFLKVNLILVSFSSIIIIFLIIILIKFIFKNTIKEDQKIIAFSFSFFIISLLPFLGLGNIALRYSYLASIGFIFLFVFLLNRLYKYLLANGRIIAILIMVIIVSIFCLMQLIELQKIQGDWNQAGQKSQNFFVSLNGVYDNQWTKQSMQFYFINTPIRLGEAWVFPVGLPDAIWFVFQNKGIIMNQSGSVDSALANVKNSQTDKVFLFNDDGSFVEKKKIQ